jgi:MFS family permease
MAITAAEPAKPAKPAERREQHGGRAVPARWLAGLTRNVYVLGAASFFTDVSSEMIMPLRMIFLVLVLKTPLPLAGLIEGIAEATASLLKIVSGRLADRVPRRKPLVLGGYSISNVVKPLLALSNGWGYVLGLVFIDRIGKGLRGSPRDAMIADVTPAEHRGKAFGLHRAMDTLGAAIGPLLAVWIIARSPEAEQQSLGVLRQVFAWTAIPGALAILAVFFFLHEPPVMRRRHSPAVGASTDETGSRVTQARLQGRWQRLAALGGRFWLFTAIATLFALGNSSDAFLFLRAISMQAWLEAIPLVYLGYNVVYAALCTPLGALSDRFGRVPVLVAGYGAFALVYLGWAATSGGWQITALFLTYGIYAAATEGVAKALVVDLVPRAQRGTALGWFNGLTGFAALPANVIAGWAWLALGASSPFVIGGVLAFGATICLALAEPRLRPASRAVVVPA